MPNCNCNPLEVSMLVGVAKMEEEQIDPIDHCTPAQSVVEGNDDSRGPVV